MLVFLKEILLKFLIIGKVIGRVIGRKEKGKNEKALYYWGS